MLLVIQNTEVIRLHMYQVGKLKYVLSLKLLRYKEQFDIFLSVER